MGTRPIAVLIVVAGGAAAIASLNAAGGGSKAVAKARSRAGVNATLVSAAPLQAPSAEQTHPRARPPVGGRRTAFAVLFSLRQAPGHHGVLAVEYRVGVSRPVRSSPSCTPPQPPAVEAGAAGTIARVRLAVPTRGWCPGRYRATVYLQRGPYCPPPLEGGPPTPCPLFATQELDTGAATFTVRPKSAGHPAAR